MLESVISGGVSNDIRQQYTHKYTAVYACIKLCYLFYIYKSSAVCLWSISTLGNRGDFLLVYWKSLVIWLYSVKLEI